MGKYDGKLILSDMDGTLLSSDRTISRENREAIDHFIQHGGRFGVATGRTKRGMEYFLKDVSVNAPCIVANGAVIYDFQAEKAAKTYPVGQDGVEVAKEVIHLFPYVGVEVYMVDEGYIVQDSPLTQRHFNAIGVKRVYAHIDDVPEPWINLNLTCSPEWVSKVLTHFFRHFHDRVFYQVSLPHIIEVMALGSSKARAALDLCELLGISNQDLYVVGDGTNDIELLGCTKNAYAPQNACAEVQSMNLKMLPDNDSGAIAALIEQL